MKKIEISRFKFMTVFLAFAIVVVAILGGVQIEMAINYYQTVSVHIDRAEGAANAKIAYEELENAMREIEKRGLVSGEASSLKLEAKNSVGSYYNNLKMFQSELKDLTEKSSELYYTEFNAIIARLERNSAPFFMFLNSKDLADIVIAAWVTLGSVFLLWLIEYKVCCQCQK